LVNQIGKLDKNAMKAKIMGYYVEGKLSEDHRQLLQGKISEYHAYISSSFRLLDYLVVGPSQVTNIISV
jgi:hypothetical protein